ncbi:ATP synthase F1 subunit gamma [Candidatus Gracilibacteria bacterium]|nr:ATP synthase F1 subunit gamma [Candidatus Gracilibacteria bacterium]
MANGKEIKRRIKSIKNTAKITKAMELISTVKMKKAQDSAVQKKKYISGMMDVFANLSDSFSENNFFKKCEKNPDGKTIGKTLGVIVTSNKGLCGGYNVNVLKQVNNFFKEKNIGEDEMDFVALGKRGAQFIARTGNKLIADYSDDFTDNVNQPVAKGISRDLQKMFLDGKYSKIVVFYTHYVNTIKQTALTRKILPITKNSVESYFKDILGDEFKGFEKTKNITHTIEPSEEEFLNDILPMFIDFKFFDILLESKASEHSSRMLAMKNATDNAKKFAEELNLKYNKARQAAITTEIGEIVGGVESMKDVS